MFYLAEALLLGERRSLGGRWAAAVDHHLMVRISGSPLGDWEPVAGTGFWACGLPSLKNIIATEMQNLGLMEIIQSALRIYVL